MLYQGLPVIPEDDVLDELVLGHHNVHVNHSHRYSKGRAPFLNTELYSTNSSDDSSNLSPFGYVAVLRNDTILLEVGRSAFDITDDITNQDDDDSLDEEFSATSALDETILGLLDKPPNPTWDSYNGNCSRNNGIDSVQRKSDLWTGLRFHCYDRECGGEEKRGDNGDSASTPATTIWSFCVVYSNTENGTVSQQQPPLELIIRQWIMEHLVHFTKLFRQNDVVWKTGPTLSCQYVFAPVLQQRMMILHQQCQQQRANARDNDASLLSSLNWMEIADKIVEKNHEILRKASLATPHDDSLQRDIRDSSTISRNNTDAPPFVSDESDNEEDEDSCKREHVFDDVMDDDAETSSSDEEEEDELLLSSTPVRTGALPINYFYNNFNHHFDGNDNDDESSSYLDRIVASTTSIWTKHSDVTSNQFSIPRNAIPTNEIIPPVPIIDSEIHQSKNKMYMDSSTDQNSDNMDSDDETIPLICFVGNQVDAQHSDLWKRSPKCITKAVALGIANVTSQPTNKATKHEPSDLLQTTPPVSCLTSDTEHKAWWDVFAQNAATTLDLFWKNITTRICNNNDRNDENSNNNELSNEDQHHNARHPCFWCESIFQSKASAMQ